MLRSLTRLARELNWSRRKWSTASDREFHDDLYRRDDYDPFSLAYSGYTTIRRFADLVEPALPQRGTVLDLGCGPGEITCEIAARHRDLSFVGVDHSSAAIAKARANMSRRSVTNIRFECGNVEAYTPAGSIDLVTLFDSFHHLTQPAAFVTRLGPQVKRWALVEPRGSWAGTWQKDLDFDWIARDLDNIRAHITSLVPAFTAHKSSTATARLAEAGRIDDDDQRRRPDGPRDAVERRYTLDDLQRLFEGYALDLRGTVAGLESYPPGANIAGELELRERFGELRYQLFRDIDEWLFARGLDLHAKHWFIVAERGGKSRTVNLARLSTPPSDVPAVAGPYDVRYGAYLGPREAAAGQRVVGAIELTNEGWEPWSSQVENGVFTSYHWLDAKGQIVAFDGERTPLPRPIVAGANCKVAMTIHAPTNPGRYRLAIDLVREGVTWFSQAGRPWLEVPFEIK